MTPTNFAWMVASNPDTAAWLKEIAVDPAMIWINLAIILALPLMLGLLTRHFFPGFSLAHYWRTRTIGSEACLTQE
jgi:BASS family bile acid:Na+ symporter